MTFRVGRRGRISAREQIVSQIELKVLSGDLLCGQRLPSVRSLARRLGVNPRTVHAAYKDLVAHGNVDLRRGSGAYVRRGIAPAARVPVPADLDRALHALLARALRQGYQPAQIRAAVANWLAAQPPDRVVVVDTARETAELMAAELAGVVTGASIGAATLDQVAARRVSLDAAICVALPFHAAQLELLVPHTPVVPASLEIDAQDMALVRALPEGAFVVIVSHSLRVFPYASSVLQAVRGDDLLVECHQLDDPRGWRRAIDAAELVFSDVLSAPAVVRIRPTARVFRLLGARATVAVREALALPRLSLG